MSRIIQASLILATLSGAATRALAEEGDHMLGLLVGGALGVSDEIDEVSDASYSITGFIAGRIAGPLFWRVEGGQDRFSGSDVVTGSCDLLGLECDDPRINRFNGGGQLVAELKVVSVYGFVTVGAYNFRGGGVSNESETQAGVSYGAAANVNLGPNLFLGADLHFNTFFPDSISGSTADAQTYVVPSFQAGFRF